MSITNQPASNRIYALLLKLRPLGKGTLMPFSGELVHGTWMRWLRDTSPDVAQYIHGGGKRRLFTCSSLQFPFSQERLLHAQKENVHLPLDEQRRSANKTTSFDDPSVAICGPLPSGRQTRSLLTRSPKSMLIRMRPSAPLDIDFAALMTSGFSKKDSESGSL